MKLYNNKGKEGLKKKGRGKYLGSDPEMSIRNELGSLVLLLCFQVAVQHANSNTGQSHNEG